MMQLADLHMVFMVSISCHEKVVELVTGATLSFQTDAVKSDSKGLRGSIDCPESIAALHPTMILPSRSKTQLLVSSIEHQGWQRIL